MLAALQLVEKTMPRILHKMWVWFVVCFCYFAAILIGTGISLMVYALDIQSDAITQSGAIVGLSVCGYFAYKLRGLTLVPERIGHVRVITEQLEQESVFASKVQRQKAEQTVEDFFGDIFQLVTLERHIRGVLRDIFSERLQTQRYAFGKGWLKTAIDTLVGILVAFIAEVILAFYIKNCNGESPGFVCKLALTLLAQQLDNLLKPILFLVLFTFAGYFICYWLMLYPILWVSDMLPFSVGIWSYILALIFAWWFKAVFMETISVAALISVFFDVIKGQKVNAKTTNHLAQLSQSYRQL